MTTDKHDAAAPPQLCCTEIENFVHIFRRVQPPSQPDRLGTIEVYGDTKFLNGAAGGDHIIYLDFDKRYDIDRRIRKAAEAEEKTVAANLAKLHNHLGILVADVSGHQITDALAAAMLHQAFLTGVLYELDRFGEVTTGLFETLNTRFHRSLSVEKYITLVYGEISASGRYRFVSAGAPDPLVFSAEFDRFVTISPDRLVSFFPLGMFPSEDDIDISKNFGPLGYKPRYTVNEVNLMGDGDILLLHTDGLSEHEREGGEAFFPAVLEETVRANKNRPAQGIFEAIVDRAASFAPPADDLTVVVIKKIHGGA
ncbi:MAG: serine/threonine-protein phosphatase [Thermoanaerobaculales bacterium]|nr:serine/threonine-protein phosphatase [Thermoanaerobaculales bacterium]